MAVKKNPDWHVWLGDILYWIRTPPGIYIVIIAVLLATLYFSFSSTPKVITYTAPQIVRPPVVAQPQPQLPPSPCTASETQDPRTQRCLDSARGSPNSCPFNYTFVARLDACIALDNNANWTFGSGEQFTLSGVPSTTIKVLSGGIGVTAMPNGSEFFFTTGETVTVSFGSNVRAIAESTRVYIRFE